MISLKRLTKSISVQTDEQTLVDYFNKTYGTKATIQQLPDTYQKDSPRSVLNKSIKINNIDTILGRQEEILNMAPCMPQPQIHTKNNNIQFKIIKKNKDQKIEKLSKSPKLVSQSSKEATSEATTQSKSGLNSGKTQKTHTNDHKSPKLTTNTTQKVPRLNLSQAKTINSENAYIIEPPNPVAHNNHYTQYNQINQALGQDSLSPIGRFLPKTANKYDKLYRKKEEKQQSTLNLTTERHPKEISKPEEVTDSFYNSSIQEESPDLKIALTRISNMKSKISIDKNDEFEVENGAKVIKVFKNQKEIEELTQKLPHQDDISLVLETSFSQDQYENPHKTEEITGELHQPFKKPYQNQSNNKKIKNSSKNLLKKLIRDEDSLSLQIKYIPNEQAHSKSLKYYMKKDKLKKRDFLYQGSESTSMQNLEQTDEQEFKNPIYLRESDYEVENSLEVVKKNTLKIDQIINNVANSLKKDV